MKLLQLLLRLLLRISFPIISALIIGTTITCANRRRPIRTGNSNVYSYRTVLNNPFFMEGFDESNLEFWRKIENEGYEDSEDYFDQNADDEFDFGKIMREHLPKKKKKKSLYRTREILLTLNRNSDVKRTTSIQKIHEYFEGRVEMMQSYFIRTTSFVHGDTFLGLGRTTSGILFAYFAAMYCVYVLTTTLLLFQRRRDPSLSKFPLWLSHFIPAILNAIIVIFGFLRHMFRARFPCFIVLWNMGLLAPMYVVMIFEARSLNLIFEYHWNRRMQTLLQASEPRNALDGGDLTSPIIVLDRDRNGKKAKTDSNLLTNSEDWLWIKKNGMVATILGIFMFQFTMTSMIQYFSPYYTIFPKMMVYRCAGALETILPMLALIMYMFIIPLYLFIQLKRINDSYGVRKDIYSAVTQSAWIVLLFSLVRHVFFIEKFIGYVPTGFSIMTTFGILHYHTVCSPLVRIYAWQWSRSHVKRRMKRFILMKRKLQSYMFPRLLRIRINEKGKCGGGSGGLMAPEPLKGEIRQRSRAKNSLNIDATPTPSFQRLEEAASPAATMSPIIPPELKPPTFFQVLQDEVLCELFERYTLLEFSRENLLFYRAVCSLRSTCATLPQGASQIFLAEKSRSMASQFIQINAPAEINIPGPVRKRIESRLAELDVDLTLFDEAQREVFRLMQNWSYPRFLRTLPDSEIRRFNRKTRRNSTTAHLDQNLANFSTTAAGTSSTAVQIHNHNNNHNNSQRSRGVIHEFIAASACSLTLPLNIAEVSLSSSP